MVTSRKPVTWLHISDFHINADDDYQRNTVFEALVAAVRRWRDKPDAHLKQPDLIFATGDIAFSGKTAEYENATKLFNSLLEAAGLPRDRLFVIPGNHDVDRNRGRRLPRTLKGAADAEEVFDPTTPKPEHFVRLAAFGEWYNEYFSGRIFPDHTTCGPKEIFDVNGWRIAVLPVNSALYCGQEVGLKGSERVKDSDHEKLWVGKRCVEFVLESLREEPADLTISLVHHPLEWLNPEEKRHIREMLHEAADLVLSGHVHETNVTTVISISGSAVHLSAGATHQGRKELSSAMFATLDGDSVTVCPIRYSEDGGKAVWSPDTSLFPNDRRYVRSIRIPSLSARPPSTSPLTSLPLPPPIRSNLPTNLDDLFVGREEELGKIKNWFHDSSRARRLLLHGVAGVGKTELALQYARHHEARYPGGRFFVRADRGAGLVDLAEIGAKYLRLDFTLGVPLLDQARKTLVELGPDPVLLIYDNVLSWEAIAGVRPRDSVPCHIIVTSTLDYGPGALDPGPSGAWEPLELQPLSPPDSRKLIEKVGGSNVADRYGDKLIDMAGGLPIQLYSIAATIGSSAGGAGGSKATFDMDANESFSIPYHSLDADSRLLLHAASFLNTQRIPAEEIRRHMRLGASWRSDRFETAVEECRIRHLIAGFLHLWMDQTIATYVCERIVDHEIAGTLRLIRMVQWRRLIEVAAEVVAEPGDRGNATLLMVFPLSPAAWSDQLAYSTETPERTIGEALIETGQFELAQGWFESLLTRVGERNEPGVGGEVRSSSYQIGVCLSRQGKYKAALEHFNDAVKQAEGTQAHGTINHEGLGDSLHEVGWGLSHLRFYREALEPLERAITEKQLGDRKGRVNHDGVGKSQNHIGYCLFKLASEEKEQNRFETAQELFDQAQDQFENAVKSKARGNVYGRVDHASLGGSLHMIGRCLAHHGNHAEAEKRYAEAIEAKMRGDMHQRVDHDSVGGSRRRLGMTQKALGRRSDAERSFATALDEIRKGDIHGKVSDEYVQRCLTNLREVQRDTGGEI